MIESATVQEKLAKLRDDYTEQLPQKLAELDRMWQSLRSTWDAQNHVQLHRGVHSLVGSGATFGYEQLSSAARNLERALNTANREQLLTDETITKINQLFSALYQSEHTQLQQETYPVQSTIMIPRDHAPEAVGRLVYIVDDDELFLQNIAAQIEHFGYEVKTFTGYEELVNAVVGRVPMTIVMDLAFPQGETAGAQFIRGLQERVQTAPPVVFVSADGSFTQRLHAVRAGGVAFFTKPLDGGALLDVLDGLTTQEDPQPCRILVVEDTAELAQFYAVNLEQAGMEVLVVNDPMQAMAAADSFNPELILADVYMPGCSGMELAKVLRQRENYVSIPIVYLSSEKNLQKQLLAMSVGGDDFLKKPIEAEHLISAVRSRVERYRKLRALMVRDSLTGLYNHSKIKDELELESARCRRRGSGELSFAMIDVDYFKNVNDNYGHLTGDRVLKSLARILRQRLRKTDLVGRYGGEEFAVILTDTDPLTARKILNEVREDFGRIEHHSEKGSFFVTFSCGIASYPELQDAMSINDAADKALYDAKEKGRDQVVVAKQQKK